MSAGVDVNIGADTREFATSVKTGMVEPVGDAQKALDDYVAAAGDGGQQLETTFRNQQRSTEDLRQDLDKLNSTMREGTRSSTSSAGQDFDRFSHRATEGFDEVKESARSNAIEVGASFTGGFDQAAGGLQGFLAEFLAGFGPAGIVAGIAAAAGIGLITAQVDAGTEAAEAQKAAIQSLGQEYIEAGKSGVRTFDSVQQSLEAMATSTDGSDVIITLQKAFDAAKNSGADYQQVVEAIASGSPAEIQRAIDSVNALDTAHASLNHTSVDYAGRIVSNNLDQIQSNHQLGDALAEAEKQAKAAGRAQELAAKAGVSDLKLKDDLLNQLQQGYDETASSTDDYLDKEKKTLNVKSYIAAMDARRDALVKYKEQLAKLDLSPEAVKFIESQGADAAAAMVAGYRKASPGQQAKLNEIWSTAGDDNASSYSAALGTNLAKIKPKPPTIPAPVVPAPDTSRLDAFYRQPQQRLRIPVDLVARNGKVVG